jgi:hypothetical protein
MVGTSAGKGIAIVAEVSASGIRWLAEGQHFVPIIIGMVLADLQGKSHVRQRSLSAESLFGYFCGDKSN